MKKDLDNSSSIVEKIKYLQEERKKCTKKGGTSSYYREGFNNQIDKLLTTLEDLQEGTHKKDIIELKKQISKLEKSNTKSNLFKKIMNKSTKNRLYRKLRIIKKKDSNFKNNYKNENLSYEDIYTEDKNLRINEIKKRLKEITGTLTNIGIKMDTGTFKTIPEHVTNIYSEKSFLEKELANLEYLSKN